MEAMKGCLGNHADARQFITQRGRGGKAVLTSRGTDSADSRGFQNTAGCGSAANFGPELTKSHNRLWLLIIPDSDCLVVFVSYIYVQFAFGCNPCSFMVLHERF